MFSPDDIRELKSLAAWKRTHGGMTTPPVMPRKVPRVVSAAGTERRAFGWWDWELGSSYFIPLVTRTNTSSTTTTEYGWNPLVLHGDLPLQNDDDAIRVTEDVYLHCNIQLQLSITIQNITNFDVSFWTLTNADTHRVGKSRNGQFTNRFARTYSSSQSTASYSVILQEEFWTLATTQSWYKAMLNVSGTAATSSNIIYAAINTYSIHFEEITSEQYLTDINETGNSGSSEAFIGAGESLSTGSYSFSGSGTFAI